MKEPYKGKFSIVLLLSLFILLLLPSPLSAASVSNGTTSIEHELISNTDECLIDCSLKFKIKFSEPTTIGKQEDFTHTFIKSKIGQDTERSGYRLLKNITLPIRKTNEVCNPSSQTLKNGTKVTDYACTLFEYWDNEIVEKWVDTTFLGEKFHADKWYYVELWGKKNLQMDKYGRYEVTDIDAVPVILKENLPYSWWNSSWGALWEIEIENPVAAAIPTNWSMNFTINTTGLVADSIIQPDCGDFRILWNNQTELRPEIINNCNNDTTLVRFRTINSVAGFTNDSNYTLYANNTPAPDFSEDWNLSRYFFDDFEDGNKNDWVDQQGVWIMNSTNPLSGSYSMSFEGSADGKMHWTRANFGNVTGVEVEVLLQLTGASADGGTTHRIQNSTNTYILSLDSGAAGSGQLYGNTIRAGSLQAAFFTQAVSINTGEVYNQITRSVNNVFFDSIYHPNGTFIKSGGAVDNLWSQGGLGVQGHGWGTNRKIQADNFSVILYRTEEINTYLGDRADFTDTTNPIIVNMTPENGSTFVVSNGDVTINFTVTAQDDIALDNGTLWVWWANNNSAVGSFIENADAFDNITGPVESGNLTSLLTDDNDYMIIQEATGTNSIDTRFNFTNLPSTVTEWRFHTHADYIGNPSHDVDFQYYNYTSTAWVTIELINHTGPEVEINSDFLNASDVVSGGLAQMRFLHTESGNQNHDLLIDHIALISNSSERATINLTNNTLGNILVPLGNGTFLYNWYVCDTSNNCVWNATNGTIIISPDNTPPGVFVINPVNNTVIGSANLTINVTLNETHDTILLEYEGSNLSGWNQTNATSFYFNLTGITNGTHTFRVWANDTSGNIGFSGLFTFTASLDPPTAPICTHPENRTYTTIVDIPLRCSNTSEVQGWFYSLNGATNITINDCDYCIFYPNTTIFDVGNGNHEVTIYVNKSNGQVNSTTIYFTVDNMGEINGTELADAIWGHTDANQEVKIGMTAIALAIMALAFLGLSSRFEKPNEVTVRISCIAIGILLGINSALVASIVTLSAEPSAWLLIRVIWLFSILITLYLLFRIFKFLSEDMPKETSKNY